MSEFLTLAFLAIVIMAFRPFVSGFFGQLYTHLDDWCHKLPTEKEE